MTAPRQSPREAFVEAMHELNDFVAASSAKNAWRERLHQAAADADCDSTDYEEGHRHRDHASCRAALLKEIGL